MKKLILLLISLQLFITSCIDKETNYLDKGLTELKNHRVVNEDFIQGFGVKKLGIMKVKDSVGVYKLIFLLNGDVNKEVVENYSMTVRAYPSEEELKSNKIKKKEFIWDFKPELTIVNNHKYIIHQVKTNISKVREFRFGLYHRDGYKGKFLSKIIIVKNIKLI